MSIGAETIDWLAKAKEGDPDLGVRTKEDPLLAHHVAFAAKAAEDAARQYETDGNREAAINNYSEARHIGKFIAGLYDKDPDSTFLASWK